MIGSFMKKKIFVTRNILRISSDISWFRPLPHLGTWIRHP